MRGIDGLKKGSLLGVEPKGEGIRGNTGFSVTGQNAEPAPATTPKAPESPKPEAPKSTSGETDETSTTTKTARINPTLPLARVFQMDLNAEPFKP